MIYNIIVMSLCIVSFFMCLGAYWMGHKHAKIVNVGNVPRVSVKPLKIDFNKSEDDNKDELDDILGVTRESLLDSIERGRKA